MSELCFTPARGLARMIVVHHLNNSRSQRVLWLLEELGLEFPGVRRGVLQCHG